MADPLERLRRFLRELKRRNVYKVAVAYLAVAFVGLQAARLLVPATTLPGWADELLIYLAVFGFPVALVVAWAFELTPEGVRRTRETESAERETVAPAASGGWAVTVSVLLLVGGGFWYLMAVGGEERPVAESDAATDSATLESVRGETAGPPRVAVLPFENIARDTGDAFFAKGMHEEVLNQLAKVSGLEVISRTSVMRYADTDKPVPTISRELGGVSALLEGTVRRAGEQVRITAQLIDAPRDTHIWSNTYQRTLSPDAIFEIQADIADRIAGELRTELSEGERRRIEEAPTGDLAAYEAFLRGRGQVWQFRGRWNEELLDRATRNLRAAIRRDSSFAEAHAWLGQVHLARIWNRPSGEAPRWLDSARSAVERARRIEPELASVHLTNAGIHDLQDSLDAEAEALHRALELQPSNVLAKTKLASNLSERGEFAEGVRAAREAVRLDPRRPAVLAAMGRQLSRVGLHDAAEAWCRSALALEPGHQVALACLSGIEMAAGRPERALEVWQAHFRETESPPQLSLFFASMVALAADRPELARAYQRQRFHQVHGSDHTWSGFSIGWRARHPDDRNFVGPGTAVWVGVTEMRIGNEERGRRILREATEKLRGETDRGERLGRPYRSFLAVGLAVLDRREEALRELERVVEENPGAGILDNPLLDPLRSEPRYRALVRRVETRREEARERVRDMDLDLYPPRAEPYTAR